MVFIETDILIEVFNMDNNKCSKKYQQESKAVVCNRIDGIQGFIVDNNKKY